MKKLVQKNLFQNKLLYAARQKGVRLISNRLDGMIKNYESNQDQKNLLYIHIPKCAGTSVAQSLGIEGQGHLTVHFHQLRLSQSEYNDRYKFAFVRNPFDRLYSLYRYFTFGGDRLNSGVVRKIEGLFGKDELSFESFVRTVEAKNLVEHDIFFKEMSDYVCPSDSDEIMVDFVGKFEDLAGDYETLRGACGQGDALLSKNQSYKSKNDLGEIYNDYTRNFVLSHYRKDFRVFDYSSDLPM